MIRTVLLLLLLYFFLLPHITNNNKILFFQMVITIYNIYRYMYIVYYNSVIYFPSNIIII